MKKNTELPKVNKVRRKKLAKSIESKSKINTKSIIFEIIGICLILFSPVLSVIIFKPDNSGIIGNILFKSFQFLFGKAIFIIPLFVLYYGITLVVKNRRFFNVKSGIGAALLLTFICALFSTIHSFNSIPDIFSAGFIGNLFAFLCQKSFGYVTIPVEIILILLSITIIAEISFKDLLRWLRDKIFNKDNKDELDGKPETTIEIERKRSKQIEELLSIKTANNNPEESNNKEGFPKKKLEITLPIIGTKENKESKNNLKEESYDISIDGTRKASEGFKLPPTHLLKPPTKASNRVETELKENISTIENTLKTFNVHAEVVEICCGPTVARYEIRLADGIRVNKITNLADNLAMSLAATDVRIEAPIPGKSAIGVEVPNKNRTIVGLREILEEDKMQNTKASLPFAIGKDVAGNTVIADLTKMPHLLIGGATNSGKSVGLNTLITSLLYKMTPDELRLVLIDPKRVELSLYDGIPHLSCPVVKDVKLAAGALRCVVSEMDRRYRQLEITGSRNIASYNSKVDEDEKLPYMVIVIDELADLMMQCAKEVEDSICRIAQLARAVGIHLVIATQRPSVDVITGKIKANIASRIAFAVTSHIDSRTIIDCKGAENLIGYGDMLFYPIDANKPLRVQGCYLTEEEIDKLCTYLKKQQEPEYEFNPVPVSDGKDNNFEDEEGFYDERWDDAIRTVVSTGYCSTSTLQRKFKIGYTRAARIVDQMEKVGIVGPLDGAKPRTILVGQEQIGQYLSKGILDEIDKTEELE